MGEKNKNEGSFALSNDHRGCQSSLTLVDKNAKAEGIGSVTPKDLECDEIIFQQPEQDKQQYVVLNDDNDDDDDDDDDGDDDDDEEIKEEEQQEKKQEEVILEQGTQQADTLQEQQQFLSDDLMEFGSLREQCSHHKVMSCDTTLEVRKSARVYFKLKDQQIVSFGEAPAPEQDIKSARISIYEEEGENLEIYKDCNQQMDEEQIKEQSQRVNREKEEEDDDVLNREVNIMGQNVYVLSSDQSNVVNSNNQAYYQEEDEDISHHQEGIHHQEETPHLENIHNHEPIYYQEDNYYQQDKSQNTNQIQENDLQEISEKQMAQESSSATLLDAQFYSHQQNLQSVVNSDGVKNQVDIQSNLNNDQKDEQQEQQYISEQQDSANQDNQFQQIAVSEPIQILKSEDSQEVIDHPIHETEKSYSILSLDQEQFSQIMEPQQPKSAATPPSIPQESKNQNYQNNDDNDEYGIESQDYDSEGNESEIHELKEDERLLSNREVTYYLSSASKKQQKIIQRFLSDQGDNDQQDQEQQVQDIPRFQVNKYYQPQDFQQSKDRMSDDEEDKQQIKSSSNIDGDEEQDEGQFIITPRKSISNNKKSVSRSSSPIRLTPEKGIKGRNAALSTAHYRLNWNAGYESSGHEIELRNRKVKPLSKNNIETLKRQRQRKLRTNRGNKNKNIQSSPEVVKPKGCQVTKKQRKNQKKKK